VVEELRIKSTFNVAMEQQNEQRARYRSARRQRSINTAWPRDLIPLLLDHQT